MTITHDALDLTVQVIPWSLSQTWDLTVQGSPASDIWWQSLKTGSNLYTSGPPNANIWWLLKYVCLMKAGGTHPTGVLSCMT